MTPYRRGYADWEDDNHTCPFPEGGDNKEAWELGQTDAEWDDADDKEWYGMDEDECWDNDLNYDV